MAFVTMAPHNQRGTSPSEPKSVGAHVKTRVNAAAVALLAAASLALAPSALANEYSAAYRVAASASIDGVKGNQGIRTDPPTVAGIGFVHAAWIDTGGPSGDFVSIGTSNGAGAQGSPGQSTCADDYDPRWTIYADGQTGGLYWCTSYTQDAYTTGVNPTFQIYYDFCSPSGPNAWVLTFAGTQRKCATNSGSGGSRASVGLETAGGSTVDRNIDVKYTNLQVNLTGSTTWINFSQSGVHVDPSYSLTVVSATAVNAYLAPLN